MSILTVLRMTCLSFDRPRTLLKNESIHLPELIDDEYLSDAKEGQQPQNVPSRLTFFIYAMKLLDIREKSRIFEAEMINTRRTGYTGQELGATLDLISDIDRFFSTLPPYLQVDHTIGLLKSTDEACFQLQARVLKAR